MADEPHQTDDAPGGESAAERPRPARPPSVRDGSPPPTRRTSEGEGSADAGRPTPVRLAMEAERERPMPVLPPSCTFLRGEEEWIARVVGRGRTGLPADSGAPLLFLTFARASEPDEPVLEVITAARRLEDIPPGRLGLLLDDARPYDGEWEGSELFPRTRKSHPSRR